MIEITHITLPSPRFLRSSLRSFPTLVPAGATITVDYSLSKMRVRVKMRRREISMDTYFFLRGGHAPPTPKLRRAFRDYLEAST